MLVLSSEVERVVSEIEVEHQFQKHALLRGYDYVYWQERRSCYLVYLPKGLVLCLDYMPMRLMWYSIY